MRVEGSASRVFLPKSEGVVPTQEDKEQQKNDSLISIWNGVVGEDWSNVFIAQDNLLLAQLAKTSVEDGSSTASFLPLGITQFYEIQVGVEIALKDAWLYVVPTEEEQADRLKLTLTFLEVGMSAEEAFELLGQIVTARIGDSAQKIVDLAAEITAAADEQEQKALEEIFAATTEYVRLSFDNSDVLEEQSRLRLRRMLLTLINGGKTVEEAGGALFELILSGRIGLQDGASSDASSSTSTEVSSEPSSSGAVEETV